MESSLMVDDLHRSVWFAYRTAIEADASWDAATAFQRALDIYLARRRGVDAASACRETGRMIMIRPRGVGNRRRILQSDDAAHHAPAAVLAVARLPIRSGRAARL
jgi:hypothetical protein